MRGKAKAAEAANAAARITPAYAGKSFDSLTVCRRLRDHPRVCGEKLLTTHLQEFLSGSPPRMRGKGSRSTVLL